MIRGERIVLRAVERGDIERWRVWFNDPETRRYLAWVYPYGEWDGERFYEHQKTATDQKVFSIDTTNGVHIGSIDLRSINWIDRNAVMGILIGDPAYRDKGLGTDAVRTLLRFAFEQMNLHRVSLCTFEYNERAHACYLKAGFKEEGRRREVRYADGRYWDAIEMGVLKSEFLGQNA